MRTPRRRRRPSSIDKLDPEIRDLIGKLRIDRGFTIDEIRAALEKMLDDEHLPSRSALGRHVRSLEEIGAQLRHSREVANALVAQIGDAPEDRVAELNIELAHTMMLKLLTATNDEGDGLPVVLSAEEQMFIGRTLSSLASARKTNAEMAFKIRKQATEEAADRALSVAKEKGFSKETADAIFHAVLGSDAG